jgi:hypothetical protein
VASMAPREPSGPVSMRNIRHLRWQTRPVASLHVVNECSKTRCPVPTFLTPREQARMR